MRSQSGWTGTLAPECYVARTGVQESYGMTDGQMSDCITSRCSSHEIWRCTSLLAFPTVLLRLFGSFSIVKWHRCLALQPETGSRAKKIFQEFRLHIGKTTRPHRTCCESHREQLVLRIVLPPRDGTVPDLFAYLPAIFR